MSNKIHSSCYISAAHKSSGKTIITTGICSALKDKGFNIQPFKKGPDYIDPLWLSISSGNKCYNLDFNLQRPEQILNLVKEKSASANGVIVEGNKGLHDGVDIYGNDSNASLARLLQIPVVLVIDASGITRGIAPLLLGYEQFDSEVFIQGVILNKVGGSRHESKLRQNIEAHTNFSVIGSIPRDPRMVLEERHLGLIPSNELDYAEKLVHGIKDVVNEYVDVDSVLQPVKNQDNLEIVNISKPKTDVRIGLARDEVFGFYYEDDLEEFSRQGAELVCFNTLNDEVLPENLDGLFIGGGFPEMHLQALSQNLSMKQSIWSFINFDGVVYAECGGLMYLAQSIQYNDNELAMVGALPVKTVMQHKPVGHGYVKLKETGDSKWGLLMRNEEMLCAHEFHYSKAELTGHIDSFAYEIERGYGFDGNHDGIIYKNVLASYSHLRSIDSVNWVAKFVKFVRFCSHSSNRRHYCSSV